MTKWQPTENGSLHYEVDGCFHAPLPTLWGGWLLSCTIMRWMTAFTYHCLHYEVDGCFHAPLLSLWGGWLLSYTIMRGWMLSVPLPTLWSGWLLSVPLPTLWGVGYFHVPLPTLWGGWLLSVPLPTLWGGVCFHAPLPTLWGGWLLSCTIAYIVRGWMLSRTIVHGTINVIIHCFDATSNKSLVHLRSWLLHWCNEVGSWVWEEMSLMSLLVSSMWHLTPEGGQVLSLPMLDAFENRKWLPSLPVSCQRSWFITNSYPWQSEMWQANFILDHRLLVNS